MEIMPLFGILCAICMARVVNGELNDVEGCDTNQLHHCQALVPANSPEGMPRNREELDTLCSTYNRGMSCFDEWMQRCLPTDGKRIIEHEVGSERALMRFLCANGTALRTAFLKESACWERVSDNWAQCVRQLHATTEEVAARATRLTLHHSNTQLCCAHESYMHCVAVASHVCSAAGSKLLQRMAWLLSKDEVSCADHQPHRCKASTTTSATTCIATFTAGIVYFFYKSFTPY